MPLARRLMTFKAIRDVVSELSVLYPIKVPLWHFLSAVRAVLVTLEAGSPPLMVCRYSRSACRNSAPSCCNDSYNDGQHNETGSQ